MSLPRVTGECHISVEPEDGGACVVAGRRYRSDRERPRRRVTLEARPAPADCQTEVLGDLQVYAPVLTTDHHRCDDELTSVRLDDFVAERLSHDIRNITGHVLDRGRGHRGDCHAFVSINQCPADTGNSPKCRC